MQQLQLRAYLYGVIWRDVLPYRRRCEQPVKMIRLLFAALLVLSSTFAWGETCTVISVPEGDSLRVRCPGQKKPISIRLMQIDAPELDQPNGIRSRDFLRFICPVGMNVLIESQGKKDRHERTLGSVTCNEINANVAMVKAGHAWVYSKYAKDKELYALQAEARATHMGLWREPEPVAPWEFREAAPRDR